MLAICLFWDVAQRWVLACCSTMNMISCSTSIFDQMLYNGVLPICLFWHIAQHWELACCATINIICCPTSNFDQLLDDGVLNMGLFLPVVQRAVVYGLSNRSNKGVVLPHDHSMSDNAVGGSVVQRPTEEGRHNS